MLLSTLSQELNARFKAERIEESAKGNDVDEELQREIQLDRLKSQNEMILNELDEMRSQQNQSQRTQPMSPTSADASRYNESLQNFIKLREKENANPNYPGDPYDPSAVNFSQNVSNVMNEHVLN